MTAVGYRFGALHFDRVACRVVRGSEPMLYLLERPATLVTKEELPHALPPDANVTENALAQAISELRHGLGDGLLSPQFIRTVARRGYRFIAGVSASSEPADTAVKASDPAGVASPTSRIRP